MAHGYAVALFDILGFESKFAELGLNKIMEIYGQLINVINYRQFQHKRVFGDFHLK